MSNEQPSVLIAPGATAPQPKAPRQTAAKDATARTMNQNRRFALGGGGYCLYAPRFPRYQETPGFADLIIKQLAARGLIEQKK